MAKRDDGQEDDATVEETKDVKKKRLKKADKQTPTDEGSFRDRAINLLSQYGASMTQADQGILKQLRELEAAAGKESILSLKQIKWGPDAAQFYADAFSKGGSMAQQKIDDLMSNFDRQAVRQSIFKFNTNISLEMNIHDVDQGEKTIDHRFLLPLLFHAVSPQNLIICSQFIHHKCLSYTITSLSSECDDVRALGYSILSRFYQHLESSISFRDRELWMTFIDLLRTSVQTENAKIPRLVTAFLTDAIEAILMPRSVMFPYIRSFLQRIKCFEPASICMFLCELLWKDIEDYVSLEKWTLGVIHKGIETETDVNLLAKHKIIDTLSSFALSSLTDTNVRGRVLAIMIEAFKLEGYVWRALKQGLSYYMINLYLKLRHFTTDNEALLKTYKRALQTLIKTVKSNPELAERHRNFIDDFKIVTNMMKLDSKIFT